MPWRTFASNGSSRSCHSRRTAARRASGVASLASHTSAAARRAIVVGLRGDPRPGVGLRHPALLDEPAQPHLLRRPHDDDEVVLRAQVLLDEERHVVHDDGVRPGRGDELLGARPDGGVRERLEVSQGGRVTEDHPAERSTVQTAVRGDHVGAEAVDHGGERRHPGLDDLAGHGVRIDDGRPQRLQLRRHRRLAGADAPGEAHAQHGGDPIVSDPARPTRGPRGTRPGLRSPAARRTPGW